MYTRILKCIGFIERFQIECRKLLKPNFECSLTLPITKGTGHVQDPLSRTFFRASCQLTTRISFEFDCNTGWPLYCAISQGDNFGFGFHTFMECIKFTVIIGAT